MTLPALLRESPSETIEAATAGRDAAIRDLLEAHRALDEIGVPRRILGRVATVTERVRVLGLCLPDTREMRADLVAVGRAR